MKTSSAGTASEIASHRGVSPIGSVQRHYRLNPPLATGSGRSHEDVVIIPGAKATYAFSGDSDGGVTDFFEALATRPASEGDDESALAALGYRLVA